MEYIFTKLWPGKAGEDFINEREFKRHKNGKEYSRLGVKNNWKYEVRWGETSVTESHNSDWKAVNEYKTG